MFVLRTNGSHCEESKEQRDGDGSLQVAFNDVNVQRRVWIKPVAQTRVYQAMHVELVN
jgi:hypothetical protein